MDRIISGSKKCQICRQTFNLSHYGIDYSKYYLYCSNCDHVIPFSDLCEMYTTSSVDGKTVRLITLKDGKAPKPALEGRLSPKDVQKKSFHKKRFFKRRFRRNKSK